MSATGQQFVPTYLLNNDIRLQKQCGIETGSEDTLEVSISKYKATHSDTLIYFMVAYVTCNYPSYIF